MFDDYYYESTALLLLIICCVALLSSFGNSYHQRKVIISSTRTIIEEIKPLRTLRSPRSDTLRTEDTQPIDDTCIMLSNVLNLKVSDTTKDDSSNLSTT